MVLGAWLPHRRWARWAEASEAWQKEAERLLSPSRKEELAQGYLALAERAIGTGSAGSTGGAGAVAASEASGASIARNPGRAAEAYSKALEIGLPPKKARKVRLARAQAWLQAGQTAEARADLEAIGRDLPAGTRDDVSLVLAQALLKAGDLARARRRYRELADRQPPGPEAPRDQGAETTPRKEATDLKAQVLSGLKRRARSIGQERSAYLQERVFRNAVRGVEVQQMMH